MFKLRKWLQISVDSNPFVIIILCELISYLQVALSLKNQYGNMLISKFSSTLHDLACVFL